MNTGIIPYEPYHLHLNYTIAITIGAWLLLALYSHWKLQHNPRTRFHLTVFGLLLPFFAEAASYGIYLVRPTPDTAIGFILSHFHAYVINRFPIDTYLPQLTIVAGWLVALFLCIRASLRIASGVTHIRAMTQAAVLIGTTEQATAFARFQQLIPPTHRQTAVYMFSSDDPLAFVNGFFQPNIFVSSTLVGLLDSEEFVAVLCHEFAHIIRRDHLLLYLLQPIREVFGLLPHSQRAWERLFQSQEEACDQVASSLTKQPLALAHALLKVTAAWNQRELPQNLNAAMQPFAARAHGSRYRIEQMIYTSDVGEVTHVPRGIYLLCAVLMLVAVLPSLLGS